MPKTVSTYPRVRWHNSLIFRVILLCAVLVLCLLGSVYIIAFHYFGEMAKEMESQTQDIANRIVLHFEQNLDADLRKVESDMMNAYKGTKVELNDEDHLTVVIPFTIERDENGYLAKVTRTWVKLPDRKVLLTTRIPIIPQTEIVRVFTNKYLALLTLVFLATLGVMVYSIARILRPLSELSESLANIGDGRLQNVATRKSSGEVSALEHTFNRMVASLREKEIVEANLRQAQRLSAIGNLAAGVAHDIRNPLNAIKLLSSHAIDTLDDVPEAGSTVKQLHTIRNEVDRLEEIVSGFLSLAKERELQPEPTRIDLVLEECVRLVRKDAEARDIRVSTELRAGNTSLMVDAKQLIRAILNVLINAMDACPKGGRVRVFSRVANQFCEIEIRDDGPGMSKEVAERAFEPYFTTKHTGTGLGLSITRGIIEEHGGTITLSSSKDQGCQVLITLPREGVAL